MVILDTNLLVYGHRARLPEHRAARRAIERASSRPDGWGITTPSVSEFWSVVTHASSEGRPSDPSEARAFIEALVAAGARLLSPAPALAERLMRAAQDLAVVGARIFDLQIAVTALDHGATEIWTHDRGFVTLPGLQRVDPLEGD